jgi:hypothetical protein
LEFADLLEERSIKGGLLDVMLEDIHSRIQLDPALSCHYEVVDLNFMDEIKRIYGDRSAKPCKALRKLEERMSIAPKLLLLPVHIQEHSHYAAISIDFRKKETLP